MKLNTAGFWMALIVASGLTFVPLLVLAQSTDSSYDVGVVYYAVGGGFKALVKEVAPQSGRGSYSAKVKEAHATVRLQPDQPQVFRVCGVDPTRYKLFRFKSDGKTRTLLIATNTLMGGFKVVSSESEIPMKIQAGESGCFTLKPQETLGAGEFGFSPTESMDAFMFGVGDIKPSR